MKGEMLIIKQPRGKDCHIKESSSLLFKFGQVRTLNAMFDCDRMLTAPYKCLIFH